MDIILFHNGVYELVSLSNNFDFSVLNFFDFCNIYREEVAVYHNESNNWITKEGKFFVGCMAN